MDAAKPRHPLIRTALFSLGVLLLVVAPITAPLPGPGATLMALAGVALMLRNSQWAKRRFVDAKRRWPRAGALADRGLRRASANRRRARDEAQRAS